MLSTYNPISFKLDLMIDTAKFYILVPFGWQLLFKVTVLWEIQKYSVLTFLQISELIFDGM